MFREELDACLRGVDEKGTFKPMELKGAFAMVDKKNSYKFSKAAGKEDKPEDWAADAKDEMRVYLSAVNKRNLSQLSRDKNKPGKGDGDVDDGDEADEDEDDDDTATPGPSQVP